MTLGAAPRVARADPPALGHWDLTADFAGGAGSASGIGAEGVWAYGDDVGRANNLSGFVPFNHYVAGVGSSEGWQYDNDSFPPNAVVTSLPGGDAPRFMSHEADGASRASVVVWTAPRDMTVSFDVAAWTPADGTQQFRSHDVAWRWFATNGTTELASDGAIVGNGGVGSDYDSRWTSSRTLSVRAGQSISLWHGPHSGNGFVGLEFTLDEVRLRVWDIATDAVGTGGTSGVGPEGAWSYGDDVGNANNLSAFAPYNQFDGGTWTFVNDPFPPGATVGALEAGTPAAFYSHEADHTTRASVLIWTAPRDMTVAFRMAAWTPADGAQQYRSHDVSWRYYDTNGTTLLDRRSRVIGDGDVGSSYATRWTSSRRMSVRAGQTISVWHSRRGTQGFVGVDFHVAEVETWDLVADFSGTAGAAAGIGPEGAWSYGDDVGQAGNLSAYAAYNQFDGSTWTFSGDAFPPGATVVAAETGTPAAFYSHEANHVTRSNVVVWTAPRDMKVSVSLSMWTPADGTQQFRSHDVSWRRYDVDATTLLEAGNDAVGGGEGGASYADRETLLVGRVMDVLAGQTISVWHSRRGVEGFVGVALRIEETVVAEDSFAPEIICPANLTAEATSAAGAPVAFAASATDNVTVAPSITYSQAPGSTFAIGTTTVTATATDDAGNSSACSFNVTVRDTAGPTIENLPTSPLVVEAISPAGGVATFAPTATDSVSGSVPVVCNPASGSTFPIGTTQVTCTAQDAAGNVSTATFNVQVVDTIPPTIDAPALVTVEAGTPVWITVIAEDAASNHPIDVQWDAPGHGSIALVDLTGGAATRATFEFVSSAGFAGDDLWLVGAYDDARNLSDLAEVTIRVVDTTAPTISGLPAWPPVLAATGPTGAVATFASPTAADYVGGDVPVSCSPPSGSLFPVGTTTVTCTAQDAAGNVATAAFDVRVDELAPGSWDISADAVGTGGSAGVGLEGAWSYGDDVANSDNLSTFTNYNQFDGATWTFVNDPFPPGATVGVLEPGTPAAFYSHEANHTTRASVLVWTARRDMKVAFQMAAWTPADGAQQARSHDVSWRWYDTDGTTVLDRRDQVVGGGGVGSSYATRWASSQTMSVRAGQTISVWHSRVGVEGYVGVDLRVTELGRWDLAGDFGAPHATADGIGPEGVWSYGDDVSELNSLSGFAAYSQFNGGAWTFAGDAYPPGAAVAVSEPGGPETFVSHEADHTGRANVVVWRAPRDMAVSVTVAMWTPADGTQEHRTHDVSWRRYDTNGTTLLESGGANIGAGFGGVGYADRRVLLDARAMTVRAGQTISVWHSRRDVQGMVGVDMRIEEFANTPPGTNVSVQPNPSTSLTFDRITSPGETTVHVYELGDPIPPDVPPNFQLSGTGSLLDISTTAEFDGSIGLAIHYEQDGMDEGGSRERQIRLLHYVSSQWVDATDYARPGGFLDMASNIVYGRTTSLSPFAIVRAQYGFSGFGQPVNADGSSVFKLGKVVPLKFSLSGGQGADVPDAVARLRLYRLTDTVLGTAEESSAVSPGKANTGDLFRYDATAKQYVFNLSTTDLAQGSYRATVLLDDGSAHSVRFSLRKK